MPRPLFQAIPGHPGVSRTHARWAQCLPDFAAVNLSSRIDAATLAVGNIVSTLALQSMDILGLSVAVYNDAVNSSGALFGISNMTTLCLVPGVPDEYFFGDASDINGSVSSFSDPLHPLAAFGLLIG
ncbi:MAG: hypothetical protein ACI90C_000061 [Rhodoferax sp.]